jgi:ABC-type branched-subunit amino acid transport system permease subunit
MASNSPEKAEPSGSAEAKRWVKTLRTPASPVTVTWYGLVAVTAFAVAVGLARLRRSPVGTVLEAIRGRAIRPRRRSRAARPRRSGG